MRLFPWVAMQLTIFEVTWLLVEGSADNSEFYPLKVLSLDTRSLAEPFFCLAEGLAGLDNEFEWNTVWLGRLLIKMIAEDSTVIFGGLELFFWDLLSVENDELVDTRNIEVIREFLVDFAAMHLVNAHLLHGLIVKIELLL